MGDVLRLATSQEKIPVRACADCRYFVPDVAPFESKVTLVLSRRFPFVGVRRKPSSSAYATAICIAGGGKKATYERESYGLCRPEGKMWQPR